MSGPGDPPEGTPEGASGGGEDEYRSVVFDESFVRAARIQEYSAREREDDASHPVRIRHVLPRGLARQAVALILLIVLAFGFAIYMGVRHPYKARDAGTGEQLRVTVVPLVPGGTVPAVSPKAPFTGTEAAGYSTGVAGLNVPKDMHRIGGYSESEVTEGYDTAVDFITESALEAQTVTGGDVGEVRALLDPSQIAQFDRSLSDPAADGSREVTGWMVRFDPDPAVRVELAGGDAGIRVNGSWAASQTGDDHLEIVADHTYVYAISGSSDPDRTVSLFTVRRKLRFHFDHQELTRHRIEVVQADVAAGPLACSAEVQSYFQPILAGQSAPDAVAGADPYNRDHPPGAVCAPLTDATGAPAPPATATTPATATATATAAGSPAAHLPGPGRSPLLTPQAVPQSPATYRLL
ncbi:SCO2583 family membrane protein [Actinacidiphila bryophytorum]|uniref:Uncharacterized protein n=1 Tax=Actinacidiphila bryophytorum TaxID=1436133 RepID=A0A9W4E9N0_9ACTN|nr:hypothetical protein [Actinacidiphila bryophytorum]MBM9434545.1 hypothetical protein [Actinacidiphila bryophytorum]MBN6545138.1 hypothetical protein [Actinacidiphila bryophytorum]CAG7627278.1 conserved hypothetical protein [Actinacidiphila bryophytorum]